MALMRMIIACLSFSLLAPTMAMSQTGQSSVENQITAQGYVVILSETTWLGRLRVLAVRGDFLREVVVGPGTGEVLRDAVYKIPGLAAAVAKARKGADGRLIVDLDSIGASDGKAAGPQEPMVGIVGDPGMNSKSMSGPAEIGAASQ